LERKDNDVEELCMNTISQNQQMQTGPKSKDRRRSSYNESADEPPRLIEKEAIDIEKETPADETEPMQQVEDQEGVRPPAFED
jgi:hypothetical protein